VRLKAKPWVPRGNSAANAITTADFIGTESSGWQTWTSVDRAGKYAEGCALQGRTDIALSAGVGLRWPVNLALSGLTAERDLAVTVALKELAPSLHLCKNLNQKANTNPLSPIYEDSQI